MKIKSIDGQSYILFSCIGKELENSIPPVFYKIKVEFKLGNLMTNEIISVEKADLDYLANGINNLVCGKNSNLYYTDLDEQLSLHFEDNKRENVLIKGKIRNIEYSYSLSCEFYVGYEDLKLFGRVSKLVL